MLFDIDGYWKDDGVEFYGYTVCDYDSTPEGMDEDDIFWYGLSEADIKDAVEQGENTMLAFVITDYHTVEED